MRDAPESLRNLAMQGLREFSDAREARASMRSRVERPSAVVLREVFESVEILRDCT
jgi:hypothetical protein